MEKVINEGVNGFRKQVEEIMGNEKYIGLQYFITPVSSKKEYYKNEKILKMLENNDSEFYKVFKNQRNKGILIGSLLTVTIGVGVKLNVKNRQKIKNYINKKFNKKKN